MGVVVTRKVYRRNVVEMGMNIANLSLDSVGEKAQGINRVLISIVNQQEEGEKEKGEDMYELDKKRNVCFIFSSEASTALFSSGHDISKSLQGHKHQHLQPPSTPPQSAPHAFFFYLSSVI